LTHPLPEWKLRQVPNPSSSSITALLREWRAGHEPALEALTPLVYDELHRIAGRVARGERSGHTLQPTALVHEAYLRLAGADVEWQDRAHFFAVAARMMRRVLVDHARLGRRAKRYGGVRVTLVESAAVGGVGDPDIESLDRALDDLKAQDARKADLVELHYFGGLTYAELAEVSHLSEATVHRELRLAKAWLHRALASGSSASEAS